jgi:hypothetical protein
MDNIITTEVEDTNPSTQRPAHAEQQPIIARKLNASLDDTDFATPQLICKAALMLGWTGCGKSSLCKIIRFVCTNEIVVVVLVLIIVVVRV